MSALTTVKSLITALQAGDMIMAASLLADDFVLDGFSASPFTKGEFLSLQSELSTAMPDFSYHLSEVQHVDGHVQALVQITGTQTQDLTLPLVGLRTLPATGITAMLPQTPITCQLVGAQVRTIHFETLAGAGLSGLLQQLGAELPLLPHQGDVANLESDQLA